MGSLQVFAVNIKHYFHISIFLSRNFLFFFVLTGGESAKAYGLLLGFVIVSPENLHQNLAIF